MPQNRTKKKQKTKYLTPDILEPQPNYHKLRINYFFGNFNKNGIRMKMSIDFNFPGGLAGVIKDHYTDVLVK